MASTFRFVLLAQFLALTSALTSESNVRVATKADRSSEMESGAGMKLRFDAVDAQKNQPEGNTFGLFEDMKTAAEVAYDLFSMLYIKPSFLQAAAPKNELGKDAKPNSLEDSNTDAQFRKLAGSENAVALTRIVPEDPNADISSPLTFEDIQNMYLEDGKSGQSTPSLVSIDSYLAVSNLREYTCIDHEGCGGIRDVARALANSKGNFVVFAHRPGKALEKFVDDVELLEKQNISLAPFVLLAVNGDSPLDSTLQARIAYLKAIKACYATNLETVLTPIFYPLPLGMAYHHAVYKENVVPQAGESSTAGESPAKKDLGLVSMHGVNFNAESARLQASARLTSLASQAKASAPTWAKRDSRVLVGPYDLSSHGERGEYLKILLKPEYKNLVRVVAGRYKPEEYLALLASHKSVLSPPGMGYDCFRTWEALAVGSVPLVMNDALFDQRLFENTGAQYIPPPHELTPQKLEVMIRTLENPVKYADKLHTDYWRKQFESHFDSSSTSDE